MFIETTQTFDKQYSRLNSKIKTSFNWRIKMFEANPFNIILCNHALQGKYLGCRSIEIIEDVYVLYTTQGDVIILFGFIGTHVQLY